MRVPGLLQGRLDDVQGIFLFDHDPELAGTVARALACDVSHAIERRGADWDIWADGLSEFLISLTECNDVFPRLAKRISAGDRLRRATRADMPFAPAATPQPLQVSAEPKGQTAPRNLEQ
jgi:hypothetical protein